MVSTGTWIILGEHPAAKARAKIIVYLCKEFILFGFDLVFIYMKEIFKSDYSLINEFNREDWHYTKEAQTDKYILWRVFQERNTWNHKWDKFELWKKKWVKNPDGNKVVGKAGDNDGGKYYWFFNHFEDLVAKLKEFPEEVSEIASI